MKTLDIINKLNLEVLSGEAGLNREINGGYVSDLLSDVIGNSREGNIWITLQTHLNIVAVASLKDLSSIIIVNGLVPSSEVLEKSNSEKIPILSSKLPAFEIAGKLYDLINRK